MLSAYDASKLMCDAPRRVRLPGSLRAPSSGWAASAHRLGTTLAFAHVRLALLQSVTRECLQSVTRIEDEVSDVYFYFKDAFHPAFLPPGSLPSNDTTSTMASALLRPWDGTIMVKCDLAVRARCNAQH
eukprot:2777568-Rhodomonas_salina.2